MPQNALFNLVRFFSTTAGTAGVIAVGSAVNNFLTPAAAGVPDLSIVTYSIQDPNGASQIGKGLYHAGAATLDTTLQIYASTNGGKAITLSGAQQVGFTPAASDLKAPRRGAPLTNPLDYNPGDTLLIAGWAVDTGDAGSLLLQHAFLGGI